MNVRNLRIGFIRKIEDGIYFVEIDNNAIVNCSLSSKVKARYNRELEVDEEVQVELSPYDTSFGRIEPRGFLR
jgi:translation initiation factor IF-1